MTAVTTSGLPHVRMRPRSSDEPGRVSSPLELLVDLTFVVAIAQLARELAHGGEEGHLAEAVLPYGMVFFAIWWAWMNFTWFASGYDTDDVSYRLLTLAQMAGVLVLAAGVPAAFGAGDYTAVTIGYAVMRGAQVAQWLRVAASGPEHRRTALRSAVGVASVQAGWILRLLLPDQLGVPSFLVLAALELAVPLWAARAGGPGWHPHHIAERYGLFAIILLGESVLAAVNGVQEALAEQGVSLELVVVAGCALVVVFALWWIWWLQPAGELLAGRRELSYRWGYAHYVVFAALGALGAGLEVSVAAVGGHLRASDVVVGAAVAVPVALVLVVVWAVHAPLRDGRRTSGRLMLPAAVVVLATPLLAVPFGVGGVLVGVAAFCSTLVVAAVAVDRGARPTAAEPL
jgi:low temperature requirement protein LtrA